MQDYFEKAKQEALEAAQGLEDSFSRYLMGLITWGEFIQQARQLEMQHERMCYARRLVDMAEQVKV